MMVTFEEATARASYAFGVDFAEDGMANDLLFVFRPVRPVLDGRVFAVLRESDEVVVLYSGDPLLEGLRPIGPNSD